MEAPAADLPGHRLELMYVVLTWVFASWSLPLIIMAITPFSLIGALLSWLEHGRERWAGRYAPPVTTNEESPHGSR
ncbi:hypothetical protein LY622_21415 [Halomonas sp. M5N1S17]|uniref:hypothetical protein n=1 Tax=Halomonas alkalisoli TaxID=2907158 RepID=UPI001F36A8C0|nr:hypothetical protein [Halomonas alkalisoli]MCE9665993.1 hypothetical protein [Halomonas alkalisoli]